MAERSACMTVHGVSFLSLLEFKILNNSFAYCTVLDD